MGKMGSNPFFEYLWDTAQWTAVTTFPSHLSLPPVLGGALMIAPGVSYRQDWLQRETIYTWDDAVKKG
jgi:hypothetical protein